jgi:hypothetical protein
MRHIRENVTEALQSKNYLIEEGITADTSFVANRVAMKLCSFPLKLYCPFKNKIYIIKNITYFKSYDITNVRHTTL